MSIPGLYVGQTTTNLVVKAYGKMRRNEIPIPSLIADDTHLQSMLLSYASGLEVGGYVDFELPWMDRAEYGKWSDECLMNAGLASMYVLQ